MGSFWAITPDKQTNLLMLDLVEAKHTMVNDFDNWKNQWSLNYNTTENVFPYSEIKFVK